MPCVYRRTGWVLIRDTLSYFQYPERHSTSDQPFFAIPSRPLLVYVQPKGTYSMLCSYPPAPIARIRAHRESRPLCLQNGGLCSRRARLPSACVPTNIICTAPLCSAGAPLKATRSGSVVCSGNAELILGIPSLLSRPPRPWNEPFYATEYAVTLPVRIS